MEKITKKLDRELWSLILQSIPISTVDAVILRDNKYLLGRRTQNPEKGLYGVIGGTIYRGETLEEALQRNLYRETKINIFDYKFLDCLTLFADKSEVGSDFHAIDHVYLVTTHQEPQPTEENNDYRLFNMKDLTNKLIAPNARKMLELANKNVEK